MKILSSRFFGALIAALGLCLCGRIEPAQAAPAPLSERFAGLLRRGSPGRVGLAVVDINSGQSVLTLNEDTPLKPASVLKVVTSAAALDLLGPDYAFRTEFWADNLVAGGTEVLTVVGGGDPDFTTEDAWVSARELHRRGIARIGKVVLDDSQFVTLRPPSGQRAYRAGSSGLSFNYNSLGFEFCPTVPGKPAAVSVDPAESGATVSGVVRTGRGGGVRVDEKVGGVRYLVGGFVPLGPCVNVYRSVPDPKAYFGRTFVELMRSSGIQVLRGAAPGKRGPLARLVYEHPSKPLVDILRDLNHYSNNFIAEQVLLALGEVSGGSRDRAVGLDRMMEYVRESGIPTEQVSLDDASGLSHANRFSARGIVSILNRVAHEPSIGPEFEISLSVSSRNGTLRERDFGDENRVVRGKTGTLDGVSSLAGYVTTRSGRRLAFAILLNDISSKDRAVKFENDLVELLYSAA